MGDALTTSDTVSVAEVVGKMLRWAKAILFCGARSGMQIVARDKLKDDITCGYGYIKLLPLIECSFTPAARLPTETFSWLAAGTRQSRDEVRKRSS